MKHSTVQFLWQDANAGQGFRTGVCLHGHTLHSKESLSFLPSYLAKIPGTSRLVRSHQKRIDYARAYWTPPLAPSAALHLEREQLAAIGLRPIVSLTDHDDVEAGVSLQVAHDPGDVPISVEWTVPFRNSIFHLGVHNLPPEDAKSRMSTMAEITNGGSETRLRTLLAELASIPDALVVLNHPFWLEDGVEAAAHERALPELLAQCLESLHAFELNGTRPWHENRDTIELAERYARPVISGGDRHACEPAACINLSNAADFAEFTAEVRSGYSRVLFMPQYREALPTRVLEAIWDILRPYPEYPDRMHWTDRIYYCGEDGVERKLSSLWNGRTPWPLKAAATAIEVFATTRLRSAMRLFAAQRTPVYFESLSRGVQTSTDEAI